MFDFLKKLFGTTPTFGMGSLPSPADSRRIDIASIQQPISIPSTYLTDISMFGIENQGSKPICVGCSFAKLAEYYIYTQTGRITHIDGEKLYNQCKKEDGIPDLSGTYASIAAKIVVRDGIDELNTDSNTKFTTGYAYIPNEFASICQAIYQNGIISIGLQIGSNWFLGIIGRVLKSIGGHQTDLHGYDSINNTLYGVNSWGVQWIGNIAGYIDSNVKPGHYVAKFDDIKNSVIDIIALLPIPKEIIDDAKKTNYKFITTMKLGSVGYEVKKLQEYLGLVPDGNFGLITQKRVINWQLAHHLIPDGIVGAASRVILNAGTKSLIPQLAQAIKEHEGYFKGSRSYRNNSPANFKLSSSTLSFYMKKLGATGVDKDNFVIFPSLEIGTKALEQFILDACQDKLSSYRGSMTIANFINKYAPMSENDTELYIRQITKKLGVDRSLQIKELI